MTAAVTVRKVDSPADFKAFFEFPWVLYKDDPNWVPPLVSMRRELLDRKKNPAWEYMEGDHFGAWRGDQLVGTITAFINHRHNDFNKEHIGWFGTFEVYDDQEAATALLDTAADWVRSRGYDAIRGPQSFTTHEETGLLINGFTRPILLMPYNYPYYQQRVEAAGFTKQMDTFSFSLSREDALKNGVFDRLQRLTQAIMKRHHLTIRGFDTKNKKADFALIKELYNQAWEKNLGFTPMTDHELDAMIESLGQFMDPSLVFFCYADGDPAGFVLPVPDFNQVLLAAYPKPGTPEIVSLIKALYYWKLNPVIDWVRTPLFGVREAHRRKGVDAVLLFYGLEAILRHKILYSDSGWILEINDPVIHVLQSWGAEPYKTYRWYEKSFKPAAVSDG